MEFQVVSGEKDLASFTAVADAAFDWQNGVRRGEEALRSLKLQVSHDVHA